MQHWFVYYKLDAQKARELAPRISAMQGALGAATGTRARLLRRIDNLPDQVTLLEVYERIDDPALFEAALAEALKDGVFPAPLVSERHTERFAEL